MGLIDKRNIRPSDLEYESAAWIREYIDNIPETRYPVIEAYWIYEHGEIYCSHCGQEKYEGLDADLWSDWDIPNCPHCGARILNRRL